MKKLVLNLAVAAALLSSAFVSFADDLFPAPWRGQPGSTWAVWDYLTPNPNPLPDNGYMPYGIPQTQIYPGVGQVWWPELNGRLGVWPLSGEIWVDVPNRPEPSPWKDIQIQLTWEPQAPGNIPYVMTTLPQQMNGTLVQETPLGGLWMHSIYTIRLEPNPPWEQILITGGIDVDQLVIDTICIPEPTTLGLLGFGFLALLVRRFGRGKSRRVLPAVLLAAVALPLVAPSLAQADDLNPPPWRDGPRTTLQEWDFLTPDPTPPPDRVMNPYGVPGAQVWPGTGQNWWQMWGGRVGVWPLSGAMEFYLPNAVGGEYKDIWIQLTWAKQAFMSTPLISATPGGTLQLVSQVDIGPTGEPAPAGANWWHSTYNFRIYPNPEFEILRIDGTVMVDQIVIDTICIPEPAALVMLAFGGLLVLRRRPA